MPIKIYDTLSRKKKIFKPMIGKSVKLFVCGPTVYDFSHIGHARTYIFFDAFAKYLKFKGFKVFYLQNITDLDDKIIGRAKESGINPRNLAERFSQEYFKDMNSIGVNSVAKYAAATDYIPQIIKQVEILIKKGFGYILADGSVYYDISKFKDYGRLSKRTILQAQDSVSRIDEAIEKKNKGDFCLWKSSKEGEPKWQSPWGFGRPGWHIEDTAITEKHFGPRYDIHGGARDLIFPHHEAEISQMEAISGKKPLVRYWMHSGFLLVSGEKMSKSLGNFITIRDFLKKYPPEVLRFIVLSSHYRSPIDYNENLAMQAKASLERIGELLEKLNGQKVRKSGSQGVGKSESQRIKKSLETAQKAFYQAMDDDFNTPKAIAAIFDLIKKINPSLEKEKISAKDAKKILSFFDEVNKILGIFPEKKKEIIPDEIKKLAAERENLRRQKKWPEADEIRKKIEEAGYKIEDTPKGPKLKQM